MMRQLLIAAIAVMALTPLGAGQAQAGKVELQGVHICCEVCAKGCVEGVLKKVDGVSDVQCDHQAKTVAFTAKDEKVAVQAIKTLFDSGSFGKATVDGKEIKVDAPAPKKGEKAHEVTVKNVHVCCKVCIKTIDGLFKGLKVEYSGEQRQKQVKVSGKELEQADILETLRKAGFNGAVEAVVAGAKALPAEAAQAQKNPANLDTTGMVFIPGGEFVRGGKFPVRVRSFYMDQYEVTNQQYAAFLNDGHTKYWNDKQEIEQRAGQFIAQPDKERWPVRFVSWRDAAAYAKWAGKRLPTEAEWEYAAAGQEGRTYPWGNEPITPERANFGGNLKSPRPVGSYPLGRTPEGVYDLAGNAAEWCSDYYHPDYYAQAAEDNPPGPKEGFRFANEAETVVRRVRRGGCYGMKAEEQTSSARGSGPEDYRPGCIGFRCVRSAE